MERFPRDNPGEGVSVSASTASRWLADALSLAPYRSRPTTTSCVSLLTCPNACKATPRQTARLPCLSHLSSWIRETIVHLQIAHNFQQSTKGIDMLKSLLQDLLDQGLSNAVTASTSITNALVGELTQEPTRRK